jgi:endogenous inhibitor of DNA gyrase (YacG/DUF329 family)
MTADSAGTARGRCPICGRPGDQRYAPFCSRRCADVDLARWLSGTYAIPDSTESEDGGEQGGDGLRTEDVPPRGHSERG